MNEEEDKWTRMHGSQYKRNKFRPALRVCWLIK